MAPPSIIDSTGNPDLLKLPKTAFLCSRRIPAAAVLPCYDWAIAQREAGRCVISGFHSQLEQDMFHYLVKGVQPIIIALARGMRKNLEPAWEAPLEAGRLLIISPFSKSVTRISVATAQVRNRLMITMADEIAVGYAKPDGELSKELARHHRPLIRLAQ